MKGKRKIERRWWIFGPDNPSQFGVLHFDPDEGLKLQVKVPEPRTFQQAKSAPPGPVNSSEVISGRDADDKLVTLFGCSMPSANLRGGMASYEFHPLRAIIGRDFPRWENVSFSDVEVEYSLLHEWLGRSSLSVDLNAHRASFERADDLTFQLTSGVQLVIGAVVESSHGREGLRITEGHWVEFAFSTPVTVDFFHRNFVIAFRRLLTLLTGRRVFVEAISFENGKVELLQQNRGVQEADRSTHAQNMVASFAELGADAEIIFRRWFEYHERLEPALNLYFAVTFNRSLYINHRFLFLAQALEVYHRMNPNFIGTVQPTNDFRERVGRLVSLVPNEEQPWLKEKLRHANEKTLAQRLEDILASAPSEAAQFIPDPAASATRVRHTRNYYTHFMSELREKGKIVPDDELPHLTEQMRGLLILCILRDLGITGLPLRRVVHSVTSLHYVSL